LIFYRLQQALILVLHLILLWWIIFVLQNTGSMQVMEVIYHFSGMSALGAGLIYGTAQWAKYHHEKEIRQKEESQD
jgi:hypothetical protein